MSDENNTRISKRIALIKPSPTMAITKLAAEMKAEGKNVIGLGAGEPDFDTPNHIKEAAIQAINEGKTKYTPVDGTPELKIAVSKKFKKDNDLDYNTEEIIISVGGKQVLFNALLSSLNPEDEVIIPSPYWVSYPDMVLLSGGNPVIVEGKPENYFKILPHQLEEKISKKTKWLIINSPSNPTGSCYTKEEIQELSKILIKNKKIFILSDDIYEHITYDGFEFFTIAQIKALKDRTLTMNGVSKSYSMTGWRIGYGAGPKDIIKAMAKIQSQSTTNPSSISQAAAVEALNGTQDFIKTRSESFKERRDFVIQSFYRCRLANRRRVAS